MIRSQDRIALGSGVTTCGSHHHPGAGGGFSPFFPVVSFALVPKEIRARRPSVNPLGSFDFVSQLAQDKENLESGIFCASFGSEFDI